MTKVKEYEVPLIKYRGTDGCFIIIKRHISDSNEDLICIDLPHGPLIVRADDLIKAIEGSICRI